MDEGQATQPHWAHLPGIILFGLPRPGDKDPTGSAALRPDGITQRALAAVPKRTSSATGWW